MSTASAISSCEIIHVSSSSSPSKNLRSGTNITHGVWNHMISVTEYDLTQRGEHHLKDITLPPPGGEGQTVLLVSGPFLKRLLSELWYLSACAAYGEAITKRKRNQMKDKRWKKKEHTILKKSHSDAYLFKFIFPLEFLQSVFWNRSRAWEWIRLLKEYEH